ncbi:hypothetical protein Nepgr_006765 [Nepenthes gracilis]|uniref:Uncharacterized protein n=1 Tax=Nepenthes gracilis TaxID=150966 RepID=A0AAD3S614_NEPGR|nr:hypothetical protein Nepgr_006765 [Nepenthes gracilis]
METEEQCLSSSRNGEASLPDPAIGDLAMGAAAGHGLYVVEAILSFCNASEWSILPGVPMYWAGGCEAYRLMPIHGVEAAFLLGLPIDAYGRVCKGTLADEMNFDNCC